MKEYGIALHVSARRGRIEPDGVRVVNVDDGTESKIAAIRFSPLSAEVQHPKSRTRSTPSITKCFIGDCKQVNKSGKAIRDGFYAAMGLQ